MIGYHQYVHYASRGTLVEQGHATYHACKFAASSTKHKLTLRASCGGQVDY